MRENFSTWYDGFLYEKFIAPQSDRYPDGFDIATLVLFLHEIDHAVRAEIVTRLLSISKTVAIAGKRHSTNFRDWMAR